MLRDKPRFGDGNQKMLFKYFISYIIIITILFVIIGGFSYIKIVSFNEVKIRGEFEAAAYKTVDSVESGLSDIYRFSSSFYSNRELNRIRKLSHIFPTAEHLEFQGFSHFLLPYVDSVNYLSHLAVYFHNGEIYIGSDIIDSRPSVYYNINLLQSGVGYAKWRENVMSAGKGKLYNWYNSDQGTFEVYYNLPYTSAGATVISRVDMGAIVDNSPFVEQYSGLVAICDENGRIVYSNFPNTEDFFTGTQKIPNNTSKIAIKGTDYEFVTGMLDSMKLTVYFFGKSEDVYSGLFYAPLIYVYALVLLIAVGLAAMFSKRITDPISLILRQFERGSAIAGEETAAGAGSTGFFGSELRYVNQRISAITKHNSDLADKIESYNKTTRESFFNSLLSGDVLSQNQINFLPERDRLLFEHEYFTVAVLKYLNIAEYLTLNSEEEEDNYWKIEQSAANSIELLESSRDIDIYCHRISYDQIVVVMCGDKKCSGEDFLRILLPFSHEISADSGLSVRWGVGDTYKVGDQIYLSFQNANYALNNMDIFDRKIFAWYENIKDTKNMQIDYSFDDEQRLCNALLQGNVNLAKKFLSELMDKNARIIEASKAQRLHFVSAFSGTIYRINSQLAVVDGEYEKKISLYLWQMKNVVDPQVLLNYMNMLAELLASVIEKRNECRYQKLLGRVTDYVDENYSDSSLCLATIAAHLRLTESYVSAFFKQNKGYNISQYIEKVRMDKAAELLVSTSQSTVDVAKSAGYYNMNTFYKAFKRYHGVNPKAFKENAANTAGTE